MTKPGTWTKICSQQFYVSSSLSHAYIISSSKLSVLCIQNANSRLELVTWGIYCWEAKTESKYSYQGQYSFFLDFQICLAWSWRMICVVSHSCFPKGKGQMYPCTVVSSRIFEGWKEKDCLLVVFFFWGGRCLTVRGKRKKGNGTDQTQRWITSFWTKQ